MYNRYIPQQDGSHRKNRVEDTPQPAPSHPTSPPVPPQTPPCVQPQQHKTPPTENISGFLRNLIPKGFDTGDLIVVLLLLLMAGDNPEEQNTALLTLALYCFL